MGQLENKVAIVAGAGSRGGGIGIGEAITLHLARKGARVVGMDISSEALGLTADLLAKEHLSMEQVVADVSTRQGCEEAVAHCKAHFGDVDILINNVGIGRGFGLEETSLEDWDTTFKINTGGGFLMAKAVLESMRAKGGGSIVYVSSLAAIRANPIIAYSASKGAVNALTVHLANRLARHNIRVNAVLPGYIDTPLVAKVYANEKLKERDIKKVPLRRLGTAHDVASATLFLASEEAGYITGILLPVDGGRTTNG